MNSIYDNYIVKSSGSSSAKPIQEIKNNIIADSKKNIVNSYQKVMIKNHDDLSSMVPRSEIDQHFKFIKKLLPSVIMAGSYRRGAQMSRDIDIVIREPIDTVVNILTNVGYIVHTFSKGSRKFSGGVKLPTLKNPKFRQLDIVFTTPISYPFTLLYFTGSKKFNIIMRLKARRMGYKLNEYGLFKDDIRVKNIKTERDIFKFMGLSWVDPKDRNLK